MKLFTPRFVPTAAIALSLGLAAPVSASENGWDDAGTIAKNALMVAAFAMPAVEGDWEGVLQAGGSIGGTMLITQGMKEAFPSHRPDGSDNKSFPSGHTSTSFAAAATLHNRHGWEVGLPAYVVASFVGLSRVEAKRHRVGDVLVGAAIGTATGHLITTKANERVQIIPWGDTKGAGVAMSMQF
ncbi:membrane-associated phospholipid phosphatase [Sphingopyxis panaciterrae]|uniref:phosphatase PAP2 family protein n=1 Tax=Sphingopyxis panaciterrae TaxID=363841 RepID=UPI00141ED82F|nr:phosphatase PAP2 family protein [Sphingopyxis panaciterrae]NIJ39234.1 membrane-associated phospholipid phosphatase [Sphingopyxis panaciterrae]